MMYWLRAGFFCGLLSASTAQAWDAAGHEIIATLAYDQLNAKARLAVEQLAARMSTPTRSYNAITLSCWMDDIRNDPALADYGRFKSWHYVDLPIDPRDPAPSLEPGTEDEAHGNVVLALKRALVVLQGGRDPFVRDQAMALAIIEHDVGDLHQPLHCATKYFFSHRQLRDDHGGNGELVTNSPPDRAHFNLHAFWDSAYRAKFDESSGNVAFLPDDADGGGHDPAEIRSLLDKIRARPVSPGTASATDFDACARESNALARDFVYRSLTTTGNPKYCRLSSSYVATARDLAQARLQLAGMRLAQLLNATLGAP